MSPLPASADELQALLVRQFPSFAAEQAKDDDRDDALDSRTLHAVMRDFAPFFARHAASFDERQLAGFGRFVQAALQAGGPLENAVSTCFVEHAHQLGIDRIVRPWLRPPR